MENTTLMDRRAAFMRVSPKSDLIGRASVKPDGKTIVRYNWRKANSVLDELASHAERHDGKVIIPFDSIVSLRSLSICSHFIYYRTDNHYLIGRIYDSGMDYRHGMDDRDGYTAPKTLKTKSASRWVKVDITEQGEGFPFDDYYIEAYQRKAHSRTPLREALDYSHMNLMFVYRKED